MRTIKGREGGQRNMRTASERANTWRGEGCDTLAVGEHPGGVTLHTGDSRLGAP